MAHDHSHGHDHADVVQGANERGLWLVLGLTTAFMAAEVVAGLLTSSLALISDAAHMFTDAAGLAIGLAAIRIAQRAADHKRTFGYHRFEILAAALNAAVLVLVGAYILYEAYQRFVHPPQIQSIGMLAVGVAGLGVNLIGMRLLHHGAQTSLNMKGAYLEVWSDMLGSLGVIVAAMVIWLTGWSWVDALVAAAIALWVVPRSWTLLKDTLNILLEGVPSDVVLKDIEQALLGVRGVQAIHDLHVWALTSGKNSLTVHVVLCAGATEQEVLGATASMLEARFRLTHTTIQVEAGPCEQEFAHAAERSGHHHDSH